MAGSLFKKRDRSTSSERSKAGSQSSKEPTSDSLTGSVEEQSTAKTGGLMEQPPSEIITQTETPSEEIAQVQVLFGMIRERQRERVRDIFGKKADFMIYLL